VNRNLKRAIALSMPLFVIVGGIVFAISYLSSFQLVTIKPPASSQISLYKALPSGEEGVSYDKNEVILSGSQETSKKVKKGSYVYVVSPTNSDYKVDTVPVAIVDKPLTIEPKLKLTDEKLIAIAQSKRTEVKNALFKKYPHTMQSYDVDKIRAYGAGQWIGVTLVPKTPDLDTMVAIFKNDNTLTLETDPPSIIISQPVYPEIPADVVSSVNRLAQSF
jgi:hypothetical protein